MKKTKIISGILVVLVLASMLCACGSSTSNGDANPSANVSTEPKSYPDIKMTDSYTFSNPKDLDFDTRYVYMGDESCKLLSDMKNFGYTATAMYEILYAKDGVAVVEYQYFITPDADSAKGLAAFYQGQGQSIKQEGNVVCSYSDADKVQAVIIQFSGMGFISNEKPETYVKYLADLNGLIEQK